MLSINWASIAEEVIGRLLAIILIVGLAAGFFIARKAWRSMKQKLEQGIDIHLRIVKKS